MNAVVYCRVSTKEQVSNLSLSTQQSRCVDFCTQNNWPVVHIFRDEGESAKSVDRPHFQQMLTFCKTKKNGISYVVVNDMSRFSRQMDDLISVLAELKSVGVRLRSVMENVDETSAGKLMRNIHGAFNQFDNDRKAERTVQGMQKSISMGRFPFGAPIGYLNLYNKTGPNVMPDPERAPLVRKAFELFATGAESKLNVLRTLHRLGLTTRKGAKVTPQTLDRILRNPLYAGWVSVSKWGPRVRGSHEPLVSMELWQQVQDILDGKRVTATSHQRNNPDFPLRVFVRCEACDTPLTGSWSTSKTGKKYPYYCCRNTKCRAVNIRREKLETEFAELLDKLSSEAQYLRLFNAIVRDFWKGRQEDSQKMLRIAKGKLSELQFRKDQLVDFLMAGKIDQSTYDEQVERWRSEVAEAESELHKADLECIDVEAILEFTRRLLEQPRRLWEGSTLEQKQRLQSVFFPEGTLYGKAGFGTHLTSSFFSMLRESSGEKTSLASPTGFEPVLPP